MVIRGKTVVARVPCELKEDAMMWKRLTGSKTDYNGWKQIHKIYQSKSKKLFDEDIFRL